MRKHELLLTRNEYYEKFKPIGILLLLQMISFVLWLKTMEETFLIPTTMFGFFGILECYWIKYEHGSEKNRKTQ